MITFTALSENELRSQSDTGRPERPSTTRWSAFSNHFRSRMTLETNFTNLEKQVRAVSADMWNEIPRISTVRRN
jgi:hypothetical protein